MRILAVCGSGLGSSLMLALNLKDVLKDMDITGVEVEHADFASFYGDNADYIVCGKDIAMAITTGQSNLIVLDNILSKAEMKEKLLPIFSDK